MRWKLKAAVQGMASLLPPSISYDAYFWLQRLFGTLRMINPVDGLSAGIDAWTRIKETGFDPAGKVFLEAGTGRTPLAPVAYWLMGAKKTITVDLNLYLKAEVIKENLDYIQKNIKEIRGLFGPLMLEKRMEELLSFAGRSVFQTGAFLELCRVEYIAPRDAADTELPAGSIDFHTSYAVLEHVAPETLKKILSEGNRIIRDDGLFVHRIDYNDHFSISDKTIPPINFLRYSDDEWKRYAGNRYTYVNRLRHDDYIRLFQTAGQRILAVETYDDKRITDLLESGAFRLDERFKPKSVDVLSITGAWIVSQKIK